jgi:crotonobetainyl-CoA:carnitine CoA-transferase CaiB-like acyl-CoA transferase
VLANLGAEVVKVEPAPEGDATRRLPGFGIGFFGFLDRSKRSFVVDLKTEEGQGLGHLLAADADVVVENYGPGTMERLGGGYGQLAALNPMDRLFPD